MRGIADRFVRSCCLSDEDRPFFQLRNVGITSVVILLFAVAREFHVALSAGEVVVALGSTIPLVLLFTILLGELLVVRHTDGNTVFRRLCAKMMIPGPLFCGLFWLAFSLSTAEQSPWHRWALWGVGLAADFCAAWIVVMILIIMWVMLGGPHSSGRAGEDNEALCQARNMKAAMESHPFATVCFFASAFGCITLLFSFGLAFHDQSVRRATNWPALYSSALYSSPSLQMPLITAEVPGDELSVREPVADGAVVEPGGASWLVVFKVGSADVIRGSEAVTNSAGCDYLRKELVMECKVGVFNRIAIGGAVDEIDKESRRGVVVVRLVGHANELPIASSSSSYGSNWDLSNARIVAVEQELTQELGHRQAQWNNVVMSSWPRSNHGTLLYTPNAAQVGLEKTWKGVSVEIAIERIGDAALVNDLRGPVWREFRAKTSASLGELATRVNQLYPGVRQLTLIDYIYFTIYTITTTGYGDIVPVTAWAKSCALRPTWWSCCFL